MRYSLRQKINGAIVLTFLVIALVFSAIALPYFNQQKIKQINNIKLLLTTLVERDREQLANEIFDNRLTAIRIRLDEMSKVEGILSIFVYDKTGKLLESTVPEKDLPQTELSASADIPAEDLLTREKWQNTRALRFTKEIVFLGDHLGFIRLYYSMEPIERNQRNALIMMFGLLLTILLLMLVVLNFLISRVVIQPLTHLWDATRFIVQGDLNREIDLQRDDELGSLAEQFDKMRDAIKQKITDLEHLTAILESTTDLVSMSTPDRKVRYLNKAGQNMIGWNPNTLPDGGYIEDIHPEWAFEIIEKIGIPTAVAYKTWGGETALIRSDGTEIPVSQVIIAHYDENGDLAFLSTVIRDISGAKKSEEELRLLRNYLANIINSMPSAIIGVDEDLRITQWNSEAARVSEVTSEEAVGKTLVEVFPKMKTEAENVKKAIQEHRMFQTSKKAVHIGDETRFEDITVFPLVGGGLEGAVIRIDDITDRVRLEEMLIQNEKMLSVGGLAAGMAHEINNPLAGMLQTADVMKNRLTEGALKANLKAAESVGVPMESILAYVTKREIHIMLEQMKESGKRASQIVTNMLSFARKSNDTLSPEDLADLLDQTVTLAGNDYDLKKKFDFRQIKIERLYESEIPKVPCDASKIQQVFLNILRNGAEAMHEKYSLAEDQSNAAEDTNPLFTLRVAQETGARMVRIEIEDNGIGMSEAVRKRVFEPFFTTKETGSGTGLGLSVSYFIITESHSGTMTAESKAGKGSKFTIRLPFGPARCDHLLSNGSIIN